MYDLENILHCLYIETAQSTLGCEALHCLVVTERLKDGKPLLALNLANLTCNLHTLGYETHQFAVNLVEQRAVARYFITLTL